MSSFPINTTIPAANDRPSDDQPLMQSNFANINSYLKVEHTDPAAVNAGRHKQVTFNSNNPPSVPTSPPVLFTNNVDGAGNGLPGGLAEMFFYSGAASASSNSYRATPNGSTMLLGGIILKWGSAGAIGGGGFSFATAFPNNCFSVIVVGSSTLYTGGFVVSSKSNSGAVITRTSGSGSTGYYYIAIGN